MKENQTILAPGKQEAIFVWYFEASRERVFKIYTDPGLVPQWWGPRYLTTKVEKMEVKPGGQWRIIQQDSDGNQYAFHGIYHEVLPYEKLVYTFEYEGTPGHILLETITFSEQNGLTEVLDQSVYQSVEDRDEMIKEGMEEGAAESYERLVELLALSKD
jgi:uncharacterized protein YndB with AHSA1/START domain